MIEDLAAGTAAIAAVAELLDDVARTGLAVIELGRVSPAAPRFLVREHA